MAHKKIFSFAQGKMPARNDIAVIAHTQRKGGQFSWLLRVFISD
jgi:hypothetical protein